MAINNPHINEKSNTAYNPTNLDYDGGAIVNQADKERATTRYTLDQISNSLIQTFFMNEEELLSSHMPLSNHPDITDENKYTGGEGELFHYGEVFLNLSIRLPLAITRSKM